MTHVLVLLAAYNGAEWIEAQIDSILKQEGVTVQIVVSDDASRDGTPERIAAAWPHEARIQVSRATAASGSASANFLRLMRTVDPAGYDHVALADQDDTWFPSKLAVATAKLEQNDAAAYSSAVVARWQDGREALLAQSGRTRIADFLFEGAGQGCTFVMTNAFFSRVQEFMRSDAAADLQMHFHDWMLYVLSRAWGERWVFDPKPGMIYRQHASNDIGARGGSSGLSRRLGMIREGWYAEQIAKAGDVYLRAGGNDARVLALRRQLEGRPQRSWAASLSLAFSLLRVGRRRRVDRAILFVSAVLGWI